MKLRPLFFTLATIAVLALNANAQSISATTNQTNTQQQLSTTDPAELTATAWNFTGQTIPAMISFISITLTLQDGNSASGEFDFNHLFLQLDNVNTGLRLNGFRGFGLQDTLTISGFVTNAVSIALGTALADGMLTGSIVTDNPNDTVIQPNDIFVGNNTSNAMTTLTLAVPEPATVAFVGMGLLLAIAPQVRRLRRNG
jgi:hypothetical protein